MSVVGTIRVECPDCEAAQDCRLVQSINTRTAPRDKEKLLAGELNVMECECGGRMHLAATFVFHDPDAEFLCQVCVGDEAAMTEAAATMKAVGAAIGPRRRLVPSLNALVEKVKVVDAGLDDRAIEMTKVLLVASLPAPELDRILLFERVDRDAALIHWILIDDAPSPMASPLASYERLVARISATPDNELRIDRAWAVEAVRTMIDGAN